MFILDQTPHWLDNQVIAVLIGAATAWIATELIETRKKKKGKKDLVFEFHREFNSLEMSKHRKTANQWLINYGLQNRLTETHTVKNIVSKLGDGDEKVSMYAIMRFFQRLGAAHYRGYLDKEMLLDLFQEVFYYWHYNVFVTLYDESRSRQIREGNEKMEWRSVLRDIVRLAHCFSNCLINNKVEDIRLVAEARENLEKQIEDNKDNPKKRLEQLLGSVQMLANCTKEATFTPLPEMVTELEGIQKNLADFKSRSIPWFSTEVAASLAKSADNLKAALKASE